MTNRDWEDNKEENISEKRKNIISDLKKDLHSPDKKKETLIKGIILSEILKSPRDKF